VTIRPDASTPRVCQGSFLTLHYRLSGPQGDIISTFGAKPATLSVGAGELSPTVEAHLMGMPEGAHATFELAAGTAFGERNPELQQWVAKKLLDQLTDPQTRYAVGDVVQVRAPGGEREYEVLDVRYL